MDFVNETQAAAGWTLGFERDGRELIVVAVKATFGIPRSGEVPRLADEQVRLTEADAFTGEPGFSAPIYEADYAHRKPFCDVLVNGSAYAPRGQPVQQVRVGISAGRMTKSFVVTGNRVWRESFAGVSVSPAEYFQVMPITYDCAFGGVDAGEGEEIRTFLPNPVGRGYSHYLKDLDGKAVPNTQEVSRPIEDPAGDYRPLSLGPIGRSWMPRASFAGTYGRDWLENRAPFWPDDFDYRYFQAAPPDQQIPYPTTAQRIALENLTPEGYLQFELPAPPLSILFIAHQQPGRHPVQELKAAIDTIVIEPDMGRFTLTWRATYPLRKSCFELARILVGKTAGEWLAARRAASKRGQKPHYKNLAEMIRARKR